MIFNDNSKITWHGKGNELSFLLFKGICNSMKSYVAKVVCTYRDFKDNQLLKMSGDENTRT